LSSVDELLVALQAFQVAFLWIHDWVPLGRLNDVAAVRKQDSLERLIRITLIQSVPFTVGLVRYRAMFGRTHAFLPERNGLVPNTAHILLHFATLATLVVLSLGS
jgi:hypothetical protein